MIWTIIFFGGFLLLRFFIDYNKDNDDLNGQSLNEKFSIIVNLINIFAFDRRGSITRINDREFNLFDESTPNQIIKFQYSTGGLTLVWKYKYFQKEVVNSRDFPDARNLSVFEQTQIANSFINEMSFIIEQHKINLMRDAF